MQNQVYRFFTISPVVRISFGLVFLTIAILSLGKFAGLLPDKSELTLDSRKKFCESIAVQFSIVLTQTDSASTLQSAVEALVNRSDDILSVAVRKNDDTLIAVAGSHDQFWNDLTDNISTAEQVLVPLYYNAEEWGKVEIRFASIWANNIVDFFQHSIFGLILFVGIIGFLSYLFFMKRTLQELDPASVVPERVKKAFNTLVEGVLILDLQERIVLVNNAFSERIGRSTEELMGKKISQLTWTLHAQQEEEYGKNKGKSKEKEKEKEKFPWTEALETSKDIKGKRLILDSYEKGMIALLINVALIPDGKGENRGVLATFDDVTELEKRNEELNFLATRDPMTGCLNRRSFSEQFTKLFDEAKREDLDLSCIMVDIDFFKKVNDNFGHSIGDEVIKMVAKVYQEFVRKSDLVARYGGEEFCIVLPGATAEEAYDMAELVRFSVQADSKDQFIDGPHVSASFGVSSIKSGAENYEVLINEADEALYFSKENGRNRVTLWQLDLKNQALVVQDDNSVEGVIDNIPGRVLHDAAEVERLQARIKELEKNTIHLSKKLDHHSKFDRLTGLPNRTLLLDRIAISLNRAQRSSTQIAVLVMDFNQLKSVNDTLGLEAGDLLIKMVSRRLAHVLRSSDSVSLIEETPKFTTIFSRVNSHEFGILITDIADFNSVTWIIKRIFDVFTDSVEIQDQNIYVTSNMGVSLYPDDGQTPEILLKNASAARHVAKQSQGQNNYQFFSNEINDQSLQQIQLENLLRQAVEKDQFALFYQPQVDLSTGKISGLEALIRWFSPELGFVPPDQFIPLAESTGLIVKIGEWVLRTACHQAKQWLEEGTFFGKVSINLSAVQLRQPGFSALLMQILDDAKLEPKHIELELTESIIMENMIVAIETLKELYDQGITFSIDDFGTGYSSLSYLKHFPVDTLKIDRSFLEDLVEKEEQQGIVLAIIAMSHSLEIDVVAEGVETLEQLELLIGMRCDNMQGYLFSRPLPVEEITNLLLAKTVMKLPVDLRQQAS